MNVSEPVLTNLKKYLMEIAPLLTRLIVGFVFMNSGSGKFMNLDRAAEFFASLGIPFPHLMAPFVATVESLAGTLIFLGLGARVAAVPLIGVMTVAIITAKREEIESVRSFFGLPEFLYIALLLWLMAQGAGRVSLDAWLKKNWVVRK
jgi:putative oxidoreductase